MNAHAPQDHHTDLGTNVPHRGIELPAAVAIAWTLAGGMLFGGAAVVAMIATNRMSGHLMLTASATLFAVGAVVGLLHGVALGILGRKDGTSAGDAVHAMLHGLIYLVPALLLGWLVAGWVAAMPLALSGKHVIASAVSGLAWLAMFVTAYFAGSTGLHAASLAYRRWPHRVAGTALVAVVLLTQVAAFMVQPPTLWPTSIRLTTSGALIFALVSTFWFYGPVITVGLWLVRRMRPELPEASVPVHITSKHALQSAGIAVACGLVLALIALPFYRGTLHLPSDISRFGLVPAILGMLATSLTDELFLRLFAMTLAFIVASRFFPEKGTRAVAIAIAAATVIDLAVHAGSISSLGLPSAGAVLAFATVRIVIPAVMFGYLFWKRGVGTAVGAHLATSAALGLMAL